MNLHSTRNIANNPARTPPKSSIMQQWQEATSFSNMYLGDVLPAPLEVFEIPLVDGSISSSAGDEGVVSAPDCRPDLPAVTPVHILVFRDKTTSFFFKLIPSRPGMLKSAECKLVTFASCIIVERYAEWQCSRSQAVCAADPS